jgi:hypothetical protein
MTRIGVFAYGSLVNATSAGRTLERELPTPRPARLPGWRRRWTLVRDNLRSEKTFAIDPGGRVPQWVLGLNIEPCPEGDEAGGIEAPNGALLELSEAELARLDLREMRYDRVEVTARVAGADGFDLVVAYKAKDRHHAPEPPPGAVVLAPYLRAVEEAFAALGEAELEAFRRTTPLPVAELVETVLVRDQIPPGNPRGW